MMGHDIIILRIRYWLVKQCCDKSYYYNLQISFNAADVYFFI